MDLAAKQRKNKNNKKSNGQKPQNNKQKNNEQTSIVQNSEANELSRQDQSAIGRSLNLPTSSKNPLETKEEELERLKVS